jgi:hypothetical protein
MWYLIILKGAVAAITVFGKHIVNFVFDTWEHFEEKRRRSPKPGG